MDRCKGDGDRGARIGGEDGQNYGDPFSGHRWVVCEGECLMNSGPLLGLWHVLSLCSLGLLGRALGAPVVGMTGVVRAKAPETHQVPTAVTAATAHLADPDLAHVTDGLALLASQMGIGLGVS